MHTQKFTSAQKKILLCVSITGFMSLLDAYIVNISLPIIAEYFSVSASVIVRISLLFLLVMTVSIPIWGKLGDLFGLKKIFIIGYITFILSSLLCGFAPTVVWLIIGRGIQGIGAGMLVVSAPAFIVRYIPEQLRGTAFGIQSTTAALGLIIGAPLGGIITEALTWHAIFLINIPIGLVVLILGWRILPSNDALPSPQREKFNFDYRGTIMMIVGLSMLIIAINLGTKAGWNLFTIITLIASIIILLLFVLYERSIAQPILPIKIFLNARFCSGFIASIALFTVLSGNNFVMPFQITRLLKVSTGNAGFLMLAFSLTYALLSVIAGKLSDRVNPAYLAATGATCGAISCAVFAFFIPEKSVIITTLFLICLGGSFAAFVAPTNKLVMGPVTKTNAGAASAIYRTGMTLAALLGVALFDAILASSNNSMSPASFQRVYYFAVFPLLMATLAISYLWMAKFSKQ